jgi:hypothetical protein
MAHGDAGDVVRLLDTPGELIDGRQQPLDARLGVATAANLG